jgi:hypothetical protein
MGTHAPPQRSLCTRQGCRWRDGARLTELPLSPTHPPPSAALRITGVPLCHAGLPVRPPHAASLSRGDITAVSPRDEQTFQMD